MKRKIESALLKWKRQDRAASDLIRREERRPLIIRGARQVGKTYTALKFGKEHYRNTAYFNFEGSREAGGVFERDLEPSRILRELSALSGQTILPEDTLIIFDEIQACERALTSLKYFCEDAPQYHVIAAGSLLGVVLNREKFSFPVGKTDILTLYPLDFEEFLWASGNEALSGLIHEAYNSFSPLSLHERAMDFYKVYLTVGGMPRPVMEYITRRDFDFVTDAQRTLADAYIADMAKYAEPQETVRIMAAWNSIPSQLAKENKKFQYRLIRSGARAYQYETALTWLEMAGIVNRCFYVREGRLPLNAYTEPDSFKIYLTDTGILRAKFEIAPNIILSAPHNFDGFKGALAENYIMQALVSNGFKPCYWASQGRAEVDFILQDSRGNIIPLEVKSAENTRSRSLKTFLSNYDVPYALRVSGRNFGNENNIRSIPLYAAFCLEP
ncbi:MAG: ATP-binding protein [Synergistaceae bacterium]|nr:ATP-binding protein [Synergistaceae bacterium]